ncbi:MAG: hypothetical protein WC350_04930 [Candidatus Micrarchaeia archaeon]|jgi:hypothetical protein
MAKLVDPRNPSREYAPSFVRHLNVLPLEADALRKRGMPVTSQHKIGPEPHYSRPRSSREGLALYSAKVSEHDGLTPRGNKCKKEELELTSVNGASLSIEHTEFFIRVMWADEKGVNELLSNSDILVQIPREEAARILRRELPDFSCVYIVGESPEVEKIRPATLKDMEENAQPDSAMFMLGPVGLYPRGRISKITIDSKEIPANPTPCQYEAEKGRA